MERNKLERVWLHFIWTIALSDHVGDALRSAGGFADLLDLPMPEQWYSRDDLLDWCEERGVSSSVWSEECKELVEERKNIDNSVNVEFINQSRKQLKEAIDNFLEVRDSEQ